MVDKNVMLRKHIDNEADMLLGCSNRLCVTDDKEELFTLHRGAVMHLVKLFNYNYERLERKEKGEEN